MSKIAECSTEGSSETCFTTGSRNFMNLLHPEGNDLQSETSRNKDKCSRVPLGETKRRLKKMIRNESTTKTMERLEVLIFTIGSHQSGLV